MITNYEFLGHKIQQLEKWIFFSIKKTFEEEERGNQN